MLKGARNTIHGCSTPVDRSVCSVYWDLSLARSDSDWLALDGSATGLSELSKLLVDSNVLFEVGVDNEDVSALGWTVELVLWHESG